MKLIANLTVILLCGLLLCSCGGNKTADSQGDTTKVTTESITTQDTGELPEDDTDILEGDIKVIDEIYTEKKEFESGACAEIYITAPKLESVLYGDNVELFNELVTINVDSVKNEYLYDVTVGESAEGADSSSRMLSYDVYYAAEGKVSILLEIVSQSGSAKPVKAYKALNFDLEKGSVITLSDLVAEDKIPLIKSAILDQMRQAPQNYYTTEDSCLDDIDISGSFLVTDSTLYIYFDEYMIAPRSEGVQIFDIPLDLLTEEETDV